MGEAKDFICPKVGAEGCDCALPVCRHAKEHSKDDCCEEAWLGCPACEEIQRDWDQEFLQRHFARLYAEVKRPPTQGVPTLGA